MPRPDLDRDLEARTSRAQARKASRDALKAAERQLALDMDLGRHERRKRREMLRRARPSVQRKISTTND